MSEITLIGYGNQGKAWAHNLRDSGWKVFVSGRPSSEGGKGLENARIDGFPTIDLAEISKMSSDFFRRPIALLLPDERIPIFFQKYFPSPSSISANFSESSRIFVFAHGYSVTYGAIPFQPNDTVLLVAPKGIGIKLRERYQAGSGVMGVLGVAQDRSGKGWEVARQIATGLGCARVEILESSFAQETQADLFSEQLILCGLLPKLIKICIDYLVAQGIDPKLATYECLHESNLIIEMMQKKGVEGMFRDVSFTAKFGGLRAAQQVLPDEELQKKMKILWDEIISEKFAKDLREEVEQGAPFVNKAMQAYGNAIMDRNL